MGHDPNGMITRRHFLAYKPGCAGAPPPLHVVSAHPAANHFPVPRPMPSQDAQPGPEVIATATAYACLGIDPTDPSTWGGRGYRQSTGMIGRFNQQTDWEGIPYPAGQGVRPQ